MTREEAKKKAEQLVEKMTVYDNDKLAFIRF